MAEIRPFHALHFNAAKINDLSTVITQPYDKISPAMQARYYGLSPFNLVHVIRGRESPGDNPDDNVYTRATNDFQSWIRDNVLVTEGEPAIYPYFQKYSVPGHAEVLKERRGFIALCRLEPYSAQVVHRHEETLSGPKADRMELLRRTKAHFGQIFFLYSDPEGEIEATLSGATRRDPWQQLKDEYGTLHSVWRFSERSTLDRVVAGMRDKKLIIADGHHRYETALAYRDLRRTEGNADDRVDYVMATFVRMETSGLTILPTHRVVHSLPGFDWNAFAANSKDIFSWEMLRESPASEKGVAALEQKLATAGEKRHAIAAYAGAGKLAVLSLKPDFDLASALPSLSEAQRRLDVIILHRLLIEGALGISSEAVREEKNLHYVREAGEAIAAVNSGKAQVCFLMNPTPIESVRDVAFAGQVMPQKSTDFYPKLLSGFTIYWLENPQGI
ncbi:MAG: DUF1015 domain-containing protein [Terriglobia bacterium]